MGANLGGNYTLANDIDCSETKDWNGGEGFDPVGTSAFPFTGNFDGRSYKIQNLNITRLNSDNIGLFGVTTRAAQIVNVCLLNAVTVGSTSVAGLVGQNFGTVSYARVTGNFSGETHVGGLVAYNLGLISFSSAEVTIVGANAAAGLVGRNDANITDSFALGQVDGGLRAAGLVGFNIDTGVVSNSYATVEVSGTNSMAGGLIAENAGVVSSSFATGDVIGNVERTGGLVGINHQRGIIKNCFATGNVAGDDTVGGLIGLSAGNGANVFSSYATGNVMGFEAVGGFTGSVNGIGTIADCFATGTATGNRWVGGFSGVMGATGPFQIIRSYSTGFVTGSIEAGGFLGQSYNGDTSNACYWDTQTSGRATSFAGTGLTTAQMKQQASFSGWNFNSVWHITEGLSYPKLRATYIRTCEELQNIALDADVALVNDIDCTDTQSWNGGEGFEPLGPFTGVLDGKGHVIYNVAIFRPGVNNIGLFGSVDGDNAAVLNLGLEQVDVSGGGAVGGLAGFIGKGTITNSYVTGNLSATDIYLGGLVGYPLADVVIIKSYAAVSLSGTNSIGGLVGYSDAAITECYAAGTISGVARLGGLAGTSRGPVTDSYATTVVSGSGNPVGGLVGYIADTGTITRSYAIGAVSGTVDVGGLVGRNQGSGTTINSYWDTQTTGRSTSAGGTGLTTAQMQQQASFPGWDFAFIWWIQEGVGYPKLFSFEAPPPTASRSASQSMSFSQTTTQSLSQSFVETASLSASASQSMSLSDVSTQSFSQRPTASPTPTISPVTPPPFTPGDTIYADGAVLSLIHFPFDIHRLIVSTPKSNTQYRWALDGSGESEIEGTFASLSPVHHWHLGAQRDGQYELLASLSVDEVLVREGLIYRLDEHGSITLAQTLPDSATAMAYAQQGTTDYIALSGGLAASSTLYRRRSSDNQYFLQQAVQSARFAVDVHAFEIEGEAAFVFAVFQTAEGGLQTQSPILTLGVNGWEVWHTISGSGVRHITTWQHQQGKKQQHYLLVAESLDSFGHDVFCSIYSYSSGGVVLVQRDLLGQSAQHWLVFSFQNNAYTVLSNYEGTADVYAWEKVSGGLRVDASQILQSIPTRRALRGHAFVLDDVQHLEFVQEGRNTLVTWLATKDSLPKKKRSGWEITNWQIIALVFSLLASLVGIAYNYWRYRLRKRKEKRMLEGLLTDADVADDASEDGSSTILSCCRQFFTCQCQGCCVWLRQTWARCIGRRTASRGGHNLESF